MIIDPIGTVGLASIGLYRAPLKFRVKAAFLDSERRYTVAGAAAIWATSSMTVLCRRVGANA